MALPLAAIIAMSAAAKASSDSEKARQNRMQQHAANRSNLQDVKLESPAPDSSQPVMFNPNPAGESSAPRGYYDLMLGLADTGAKERTLKHQAGLAEELRTTAMPDMRYTGRTVTAAHPLEFLNSGIRQGMGWKNTHSNIQSQEALAQEIRRRIQEEREKQMRQQSGQRGMSVPQYQET